MRSIPVLHLSSLGAGTLEQIIIRPAILTDKIIGFIAEIANKINLSVMKPLGQHRTDISHVRSNLTSLTLAAFHDQYSDLYFGVELYR